MKEMKISPKTKQLNDHLLNLYEAGKVFDKNGRLLDDAELSQTVAAIAQSFGQDIKTHTGIKGLVHIEGYVLHNLAVLVRSCSGCTCHYGVHDYATGASYYLGSRRISGCYEA
ncbi:MAG: hypothetical protein HY011_28715 [Acidobacteria bacterium]|nr:hypothetical protein [Acidobacteriota bacterium]